MPFPTSASVKPLEDQIKGQLSEISPIAEMNYPLIRGVVFWRDAVYSRHASDPAAANDFELFFKHMTVGLITPFKKIKISKTENLDAVTTKLVEQLLQTDVSSLTDKTQYSVEALCKKIPEFKKLTGDEKWLLYLCCEHYRDLSKVDFEKARKPLPGQLKPYSYLGRQISSDTRPNLKAHHVSLIGPYIRTLKNISGFIFDSEKKITVCKYDDHASGGIVDTDGAEDQRNNMQQLLVGVSKLHQLQLFDVPKSCHVIPIPTLPALDLESLSKSELDQLTGDFFDWFFGLSDSIGFDKPVKKLEVKYVDEPAAKGAKAGETSGHVSSKQVLQPSETEEKVGVWLSRSSVEFEMDEFHKQVENGLDRKAVFVLSNLSKEQDEGGQSVLWQLLARGLMMPNPESLGVQLLQESRFIIDQKANDHIRHGQPKTIADRISKLWHSLVVDSDIFSSSVDEFFPVEEADEEELEDEDDGLSPGISKLAVQKILIRNLLTSLGSGQADEVDTVLAILRKEFNKKKLTDKEIVEGILEYVPTLHYPSFVNLVDACRDSGVFDLSDKSWVIAEKRSGISAGQINIIKQSLKEYQPESFDTDTDALIIPFPFEGLLADPLWYSGWDRVADDLLKTLQKEEIVCVVDDSNYHLPAGVVANETPSESDDSDEVFGSADKAASAQSLASFASVELEANLYRKLMLGQVPAEFKDNNFFIVNPNDTQLSEHEKSFKDTLATGNSSSRDQSITRELLAFVASECPGAIIAFDVDPNIDESQYSKFIKDLKGLGLKIIVRSKKSIPGLTEFRLQASGEVDLENDLLRENKQMSLTLGIEPLKEDQIKQISSTVFRQLPTNTDPMFHSKTILRKAAAMAVGQGQTVVSNEVLHDAIGQTFNLPSIRIVQQIRARLNQFLGQAKTKIIGQDAALEQLVELVIDHMVGARPDTLPLSVMLPGPTGVGKTETVAEMIKYLGLEVMNINGSQYAEEHTVSRLSGSPTGYVGPDEGVLFTFLKNNPYGLVFIDEYDKLHPVVRKFLMELSDKGIMTAGNGHVVKCPGITVIAATNAGARALHPGMSEREIFDVLALALKNGGEEVPELVARFEVIPYFGIDEPSLKQLVERSFYLVNNLRLMSSRGIRIVDVDTGTVDMALAGAKQICAMKETSRKIGLLQRPDDASESAKDSGIRYCNLRRVRGQVNRITKLAMQDIKKRAINGELESADIKLYIDPSTNAVTWEKVAN